MQRHRGLTLGLILGALLALTGSSAQAGSITLSVDLAGSVIYTVTSSGTNQTVSANLTVLNSLLSSTGYTFSSLSSNSNYTGSTSGFLQTTGQLLIGTGATPALSVDVTQGGFLAPVGPSGSMMSTLSTNAVGLSSGSTMYTGDFNGTDSAPLTGGTGFFAGSAPPVAIAPVPSGYSLSNTFSLTGLSGVGGTEGFIGSVLVTAVPEPATGVMLLTGMPLPLAIVFGLIRRRRARA
jgi:hypothetical protein